MLKDCVGLNSTIAYWTTLEVGLSTIAACLPTPAPTFRGEARTAHALPLHAPVAVCKGHEERFPEMNILRIAGAGYNVRLGTTAMGTFERGQEKGEMTNEHINGQIMVTKGLSRHSSFEHV